MAFTANDVELTGPFPADNTCSQSLLTTTNVAALLKREVYHAIVSSPQLKNAVLNGCSVLVHTHKIYQTDWGRRNVIA